MRVICRRYYFDHQDEIDADLRDSSDEEKWQQKVAKRRSLITERGLTAWQIKLFLDEDIHAALGTILKKRGFDVLNAQEVDRKERTEAEQLEYAVQQHRGIIVSKQLPIGEILRRILTVLQRNSQSL